VVGAKIRGSDQEDGPFENRVVKAGEVIATLESRDLLAQREEAQAALVEAEASERSVTTGTIPQTNAQDQKALRDAKANVTATQATYNRRKVFYSSRAASPKRISNSSEVALIHRAE